MTSTSEAHDARADSDNGTGPAPGRPETPRWMRFVIAGAVLLAVLLLAGALGMLVRSNSAETAQSAATSVDVGFSQDMSVHHRQAVLMAGVARDRSDDPVIRSLAFDIETNQLEQVGRMQGWLSLWNQASLPTGKYMTWMPAGSMHGDSMHGDSMHGDSMAGHPGAEMAGMAQMPGMASATDLERLRDARGKQLDVLFLQLMLRHHQGGVPMATYTAEHAEAAQVRNLAEKIMIAQGSEAQYMKDLLTQRGARPLPPPE